jgi:uncharacterized protein YoxC
MKKRRGLGHVSSHHALQQAVIDIIDFENITGSAEIVSAAFEARLDVLEDANDVLGPKVAQLSSSVDAQASSISSLSSSISSVSGNVATLTSDVQAIDTEVSSLSSSVTTIIGDVSTLSSSVTNINTEITSLSSSVSTINTEVTSLSSSMSSSISTINTEVTSLSSSLASLSQSFALLSASVGSGGGINVEIDEDAELIFNGDTLMTNADVYISGSGNNLYLHGTNFYGQPTKYEFSVVSGSMFIEEVAPTDFGEEVSDPWFKFDGDTLLTHADIYVSGSNNYLFLNGTDENGDYGIFYFDIVSGSIMIHQTGSV